MEKKFDVLIIGGGPAGLSIGALLAEEGVSSTIFERGAVLGGRYRSVNYHGCRLDSGIHLGFGFVPSVEETNIHRFLSHFGMPSEYKVIDWTLGLVSENKPQKIEFLKMDQKLGVGNFFQFFAFAAGVPLENATKRALNNAFKIMEDMSEEECRRSVSMPWSSWIDKNIEDPLAKTVLNVSAILMGARATDVNFGAFANVFGAFPRVGGLLPWYPKRGIWEDVLIAPLAKYITNHGGQIFTNKTAKEILIEKGKARGVVVVDNETLFLEEYRAPIVICAMPIFEAVARNILREQFLTKDWAKAIRRLAKLTHNDLTGHYLLREEIIPKKMPGWVHVWDADYGIPTYVGDWGLGSTINATHPRGKQLVCSYVPGTLEATPFGLTSPIEKVWEANTRWKKSMDKVFPGFIESIEFEGLNLQLNWGTYAWAAVPTEIDLQSPNIRGLYFAGDSVWSIGGMASDKVFQMAFPLQERILEYIRSGT